jgi:anti-sigma regulatory factor (Ser/Thr protein kinase)
VLLRWDIPLCVIDDAELLLSEVVANAVLHGHCDRTEVEATTLDGSLIVSVTDDAPMTELAVRTRTSALEGGWGLFLIEEIAESWGLLPRSLGKAVWFQLSIVPAQLRR